MKFEAVEKVNKYPSISQCLERFSNCTQISLGGAEKTSVSDLTRGHFDENLMACIRDITIQNSTVEISTAANEGRITGFNVAEC